jgi:hypothetical protein
MVWINLYLILTGVEGRAFVVTPHIDLQAPALLDVLADKSTHHTSRKGAQSVLQPVTQGMAPMAAEWEKW